MSRPRDPELTRQRILKAAQREFVEKGLAGARVDDIAVRSHTNKGMIYYYFDSKEGLYGAVIKSVLLDLALALPALNEEDPVTAIRTAVGAYFDYCVTHPDYVALMLWEAVSGWKTKNLVVPSELDPWPADAVRAISKGIEKGTFRAGIDPVLAVTAAVSQVFFYMPMITRLKDSWPAVQDLQTAREGLVDLILHSLLT